MLCEALTGVYRHTRPLLQNGRDIAGQAVFTHTAEVRLRTMHSHVQVLEDARTELSWGDASLLGLFRKAWVVLLDDLLQRVKLTHDSHILSSMLIEGLASAFECGISSVERMLKLVPACRWFVETRIVFRHGEHRPGEQVREFDTGSNEPGQIYAAQLIKLAATPSFCSCRCACLHRRPTHHHFEIRNARTCQPGLQRPF